jgi:hypothetical protein
MIDWLFSVLRPAQEYFTYMETSPLQVKVCKLLGLYSALRAFEQGGIFIVPHLLWHRASVFPVSSEGPPHSVASYDTHTRGCGGSILTRIPTGGTICMKYVRYIWPNELLYLQTKELWQSVNLWDADLRRDCLKPWNVKLFVISLSQFNNSSFAEHACFFFIELLGKQKHHLQVIREYWSINVKNYDRELLVYQYFIRDLQFCSKG